MSKLGMFFIGTFILLVIISFLPKNDDIMVGAEFRSMTTCLQSIEKNSGSKRDKVTINTPENVVGFLANGKAFSCEKKITGTKGTYYLGIFWKEKKK